LNISSDGGKKVEYLIITKNRNGSVTIKDTITNKTMNYYFATVKQAEKRHRNFMDLKSKRFEKIFLGGE
jgi:hypothetical protein